MPHRRWLPTGLTFLILAAAGGAGPPAGTLPTAVGHAELDVRRLQVSLLTAQAKRSLDAKQLDAAHTAIAQALAIDPDEPTALYDQARLDALTFQSAAAVGDLRRAAENGFTDFARLAAEPDLQPLHDRADYRALMADQPAYQRRAAERALGRLRRTFGDGYLYEIDDADKLVFATNIDRPTLDALKQGLTAQAHSQWAQLFAHRPEGYTSVVVPSPADYARVRPSASLLGFYVPSMHTLVVSGLGSIITHEFTHALHTGDLEATGQEHPMWVTEGLAVLFERSAYKGDVLTPEPNVRLYEVLMLQRAGRLVRLSQLLRLDRATFMAHPGPCYAESGALMAFLYDQGLLRKFYDTLKATYARDPTGRAALEAVTGGHPLPMIERDWWQWLRTQRPPPMYAGPRGAWLGLRYAAATDGLSITDVTADGPAARAGLAVGDVIVGLEGLDARDPNTFAPLLALHKPGEAVTLTIRRGTEHRMVPVILGTRPPDAGPAGAGRG